MISWESHNDSRHVVDTEGGVVYNVPPVINRVFVFRYFSPPDECSILLGHGVVWYNIHRAIDAVGTTWHMYVVMMDVSWRGGHRDVDAGQGTLLLGKVLLVSIRVQEQSEIGRGQLCTRLSPEPCIFIHLRSTEIFPLLLIARHVISYVCRMYLPIFSFLYVIASPS